MIYTIAWIVKNGFGVMLQLFIFLVTSYKKKNITKCDGKKLSFQKLSFFKFEIKYIHVLVFYNYLFQEN